MTEIPAGRAALMLADRRHRQAAGREVCQHCAESWPCDARRALDMVNVLLDELAKMVVPAPVCRHCGARLVSSGPLPDWAAVGVPAYPVLFCPQRGDEFPVHEPGQPATTAPGDVPHHGDGRCWCGMFHMDGTERAANGIHLIGVCWCRLTHTADGAAALTREQHTIERRHESGPGCWCGLVHPPWTSRVHP